VVSFVSKSGFGICSISRTTFDWGVKVPATPSMHVCLGRLRSPNYIHGVGFPRRERSNWRYWPADVTIIGKGLTSVFTRCTGRVPDVAAFPCRSASNAHGFLFSRGEKNVESLGNVSIPSILPINRRRPGALLLPARGAVGQTANYNPRRLSRASMPIWPTTLANLAQRSLSMMQAVSRAWLPEPGEFSANDKAILAQAMP